MKKLSTINDILLRRPEDRLCFNTAENREILNRWKTHALTEFSAPHNLNKRAVCKQRPACASPIHELVE